MTFDPRGYDPQAVGEHLLEKRANLEGMDNILNLSELADEIDWDEMPKLQSHSTVELTTEQYKKDLYEEAAQGIESARLVLIEHGWPVPNDGPTGADERDEEHASATPLHTDGSATFIKRHPAKKIDQIKPTLDAAYSKDEEHEAPFFPESGVNGPTERCISMSGVMYRSNPTQCQRNSGHEGYHINSAGHTWA